MFICDFFSVSSFRTGSRVSKRSGKTNEQKGIFSMEFSDCKKKGNGSVETSPLVRKSWVKSDYIYICYIFSHLRKTTGKFSELYVDNCLMLSSISILIL